MINFGIEGDYTHFYEKKSPSENAAHKAKILRKL